MAGGNGGMQEMLAKALLGNGMAGQAADTSKLYPQYQQYAIDAQSQGQQPVPFEQWAQEFMGGGQGGMPPEGQMPPGQMSQM